MKLTPDEIELLELATEDYNELFTAEWRLRTLYPDCSDVDLRQRAQQAVRNLWGNKLITFSHESAWIGGTSTPISMEQTEAVLDNPANWEKPSANNTNYFCYTSTNEGDRVYQNDEQVHAYLKQVRQS